MGCYLPAVSTTAGLALLLILLSSDLAVGAGTFKRNSIAAAFVPSRHASQNGEPCSLLVYNHVRGGASRVASVDDDDEDESDQEEESDDEVDEIVGKVLEEIERDGGDDKEEEEDEEEEDEKIDAKLTASAMKSSYKAKAKLQAKKSAKIKEAVSSKLSSSSSSKTKKTVAAKKKSKSSSSSMFRVPYIMRALINPFTVFAMTRAFWVSLFNLDYPPKDSSQDLRSSIEEKNRNSGPRKPKRKMRRGQAKTISDLPQLNT